MYGAGITVMQMDALVWKTELKMTSYACFLQCSNVHNAVGHRLA